MLIDLPGEDGESTIQIQVVESTPAPRRGWKSGWRRLIRSRRGWLAAFMIVAMLGALKIVPEQVSQSRKNRCNQQMKGLGLALTTYHDVHGHFPAAAIIDEEGKPLLSWRVAILPQLGYQTLYDQFHLKEPWDSPHNLALVSRMPPIYVCPSLADRREFVTGYQVVVSSRPLRVEPGALTEPASLFQWSRGVEMREVLDGTSNTLMVAETNRAIPWTQPDDLRFKFDGPLPAFGSGHPGGYHTVYADGSTRFLKYTIEPTILRGILTRDGNEVLDSG